MKKIFLVISFFLAFVFTSASETEPTLEQIATGTVNQTQEELPNENNKKPSFLERTAINSILFYAICASNNPDLPYLLQKLNHVSAYIGATAMLHHLSPESFPTKRRDQKIKNHDQIYNAVRNNEGYFLGLSFALTNTITKSHVALQYLIGSIIISLTKNSLDHYWSFKHE